MVKIVVDTVSTLGVVCWLLMSPIRRPAVEYDVDRMARDMASKGWMQTDLARFAEVSDMTVSRWFSGERRTAKTGKKLAFALGYPLERYLLEPVKARASA